MSIIKITMVIMTLQKMVADNFFAIQKLENNGIYFEEIGRSLFYTNRLDILTTIDVPDTRTVTETLLECNTHFKELCEEILAKNPTDLCKSFKRELKWHIGQIQKQDGKIKEMYGRQKRGLIDIGGKISKFVFGTMDSEDAHGIYKNLQELEDGQTKLLELGNQHIAVLQSNFNALSKPIVELQNETYEIQTKLNQLIQRANDQQTYTERKEKLNQQVNELMSLILIQCLHVNRIQEEATEIISTLENNKLHPLVISYAKVMDILKEGEIDMNNKMTQHEILRQITRTEHTEINNQIVIKISLPILEKDEYALYKPYLIPFPNKGEYQAYVTDTKYLAVNTEKTKTIELHTEDIEKGKTITNHLDTNFILFQHSQPVTLNPTTHCLPSLFVNPLKATEICRTTTTYPLNTITKLSNTNSWLYSLKEPTELLIECKGKTNKIQIHKVGLLTFFTACRVTTKEFTIVVAGDPRTIKVERNPTPPDSIETQIIFDDVLYTEKDENMKIKLIDGKNHNRDFLQETNKINNLKDFASKIQLEKHQQDNSDNLKIIIISIATTILVIVIMVILYKRCTRSRRTTVIVNKDPVYEQRRTRNTTSKYQESGNQEGVKVV